MSKQTEAMKLQTIMEQAQVFASAWSLVGGRFDGGNAMDDAEVAKNELRQMVAEALAKQPAQQEPTTKHTKPFESARVGDYNRGWNDCLFASGIVKQTEQPAQQEPVGEVSGHDWSTGILYRDLEPGAPLYTSPPAQRTWVGLTDEDIIPLCSQTWVFDTVKQWAEIIEAKLKEKNQ